MVPQRDVELLLWNLYAKHSVPNQPADNILQANKTVFKTLKDCHYLAEVTDMAAKCNVCLHNNKLPTNLRGKADRTQCCAMLLHPLS